MSPKDSPPYLTVLTGDISGQKFKLLENQKQIFGRDPNVEIPLPEKRISRKHAHILWDSKKRKVLLEDMQSLNGTYVNGEQILGPTLLKDHDRIQIGSFLLEFNDPAQMLEDEGKVEKRTKEAREDVVDLIEEADLALIAEESSSLGETGGRLISGKLGDINLADLLQMFASTRKSGQVVISKNKLVRLPSHKDRAKTLGIIVLQNGQVVFAEKELLVNEEAFFEILKNKTGHFALFPIGDFNPSIRMQMPLEALLLEAIRRIDEATAMARDLDAKDKFDVNLDLSLTDLRPDELKVFQLVLKQRRLDAVWALSPFDKKMTNQIIRDLLKSGYLKREMA